MAMVCIRQRGLDSGAGTSQAAASSPFSFIAAKSASFCAGQIRMAGLNISPDGGNNRCQNRHVVRETKADQEIGNGVKRQDEIGESSK